MSWTPIEYALGVLSLAIMLGVSVHTIVSSIAPQWRRIWRLACGHVEPVLDVLFPEGSPARPSKILLRQLESAEADDQPTREAA